MHLADSTVALSALVHGHSASVDMADISNAYHLLAAGLRTAAYFDYVPSAANIADLPSLDEFALPRTLGADLIEMRVPSHAMLTGPLEAWLDEGERHGQHYDWLHDRCLRRRFPRAGGPWSPSALALAGGRDHVRRPDEETPA